MSSVCPNAGRLFPLAANGQPPDYRVALRKAAREAGLSEDRAARISDYDFRHGRMTHLVETTGDILGAGYLVGHKHATTTNRYLYAGRRVAERVLARVGELNGGGGDDGDAHAHDAATSMTTTTATGAMRGSRWISDQAQAGRLDQKRSSRCWTWDVAGYG